MDNMNTGILGADRDIEIDIKILDAQKNKLTRNYLSRIQFHPFTYFYYLLNGEGKLSIENEIIDVIDNDLIIINSNIGHTLYLDNSIDSCEIIGFGIESISISKINQKNGNPEPTNHFHINMRENKDMMILAFHEILNEFGGDGLYSLSLANSKASMLVIELLRDYEDQITVRHDRKVNRQIDYIKNYMDNNYSEDIKLEDLSAMAYMNKFHLISEFKQAYRVTPIEYLILKRIEISKNLLISTNHSMEEVSSIVGFNSQSYFNQVFKKKVGQTPSQFRRKHRL